MRSDYIKCGDFTIRKLTTSYITFRDNNEEKSHLFIAKNEQQLLALDS